MGLKVRAIVLAAFCLAASTAFAQERLRGPVDVPARQALIGKPLGRFDCAVPPTPVKDFATERYYTDERSSVVDREAYDRHQAALRPLRDFNTRTTRIADVHLATRPAHATPPRCLLAWYAHWADGGALMGRMGSAQAEFDRKWAVASLALAYLVARDGPGLDARQRRSVEAWLARLGRAVRAYPDSDPRRESSRNNHVYWAGLAVAAAGVAANDRALFDWGIQRYRLGVAQIAPDGTLPLEMRRASKARHYHVFSLMPLVMLAELGRANGLDLYGESDGAIHRLARLVIDSIDDPSTFETLTGEKQDWTGGDFYGGMLAWGEPYHARFPDAKLAALMARHRPLRHAWLGGDMTAAFGPARAP